MHRHRGKATRHFWQPWEERSGPQAEHTSHMIKALPPPEGREGAREGRGEGEEERNGKSSVGERGVRTGGGGRR